MSTSDSRYEEEHYLLAREIERKALDLLGTQASAESQQRYLENVRRTEEYVAANRAEEEETDQETPAADESGATGSDVPRRKASHAAESINASRDVVAGITQPYLEALLREQMKPRGQFSRVPVNPHNDEPSTRASSSPFFKPLQGSSFGPYSFLNWGATEADYVGFTKDPRHRSEEHDAIPQGEHWFAVVPTSGHVSIWVEIKQLRNSDVQDGNESGRPRWIPLVSSEQRVSNYRAATSAD